MVLKKHMLTLSLGALSFSACTPEFQGEYSDPKMVEIISDKWNETDARTTCETMIYGMLSKPWLQEYISTHGGKKPVVVVADVENKTNEHIDTAVLTETVQDEIVNSGKVRFVDGASREKIIKEINYQNSGMVSGHSAKSAGKQTGADFMLVGNLSSITQVGSDGLKTVTYKTLLRLTNLETGEIAWSQTFDIKKRMKKAKAGW